MTIGRRAARVLIVDDEQPNRALLMRVLIGEGYEAYTAETGAAALAAVAVDPPDLILLDVRMPGVDGFEVCRRLKHAAGTRLIPVVMVTALGDHAHRIRGIEAGADDFIAKPFDIEELRARVRSLVRLKRYTDELDSAEAIIRSLALTIEARDAYTEGHCERLAHYSVSLGRHLQAGEDEIAALERGGYLHDVGKIGVPDALLLKPSRLTAAEFELMKQHTIIGDRLCGELRSLRLVRLIVRHHHERLDGSGYPDGLRGDQIPLLAQIVGVADVYDAVTTSRPYRVARSSEHALAELAMEVARGFRRTDIVEAFTHLARSGSLTARVAP